MRQKYKEGLAEKNQSIQPGEGARKIPLVKN
jgi:hypothetical protein